MPGCCITYAAVNRRVSAVAELSNKSFLDWGEIFQDHVLATAILDRLLHHATTLNIKGESYRPKEKKRAALLGQAPQPQPEEGTVG